MIVRRVNRKIMLDGKADEKVTKKSAKKSGTRKDLDTQRTFFVRVFLVQNMRKKVAIRFEKNGDFWGRSIHLIL